MSFLASLVLGQPDERAHSIMTRYGRGTFDGPAAEAGVSGKKIKISASYLYLPILGQLVAERSEGEIDVRGTVVSKTDVTDDLEQHGLEVPSSSKRGGYKLKVEGTLSPQQLLALYEDLWDVAILVKLKARGFSLSPGSSVPKPNKFSDLSFCKLTLPHSGGNMTAAFEALIPGKPPAAFESLEVSHIFRIDDLVLPAAAQGVSPAQARLAAKRKGVLARKLVVDGAGKSEEFQFLA
jgi:hypothetical protein